MAARLVSLVESRAKEKEADKGNTAFSINENLIACKGLTLHSLRSNRLLIEDLTLEIPRGSNVLVRGPDETARLALFQATAGLWDIRSGQITRPSLEHIQLLSELPYLPPGTLRELLHALAGSRLSL